MIRNLGILNWAYRPNERPDLIFSVLDVRGTRKERIMAAADLDPLLTPYRVIPTGYERGVIELVTDTKSRSELGLQTDGGLDCVSLLWNASRNSSASPVEPSLAAVDRRRADRRLRQQLGPARARRGPCEAARH